MFVAVRLLWLLWLLWLLLSLVYKFIIEYPNVMRTRMVAAYKANMIDIDVCQVLRESEGILYLEVLEAQEFHTFSPSCPQVPKVLAKTGVHLQQFKTQCVKVVMFEDKGCYINYLEELVRAGRALKDIHSKLALDDSRPVKKARLTLTVGETKEESFVEFSSASSTASSRRTGSTSSSGSSLSKRRVYNPSNKGQHDKLKCQHNAVLCEQYNNMKEYYVPKEKVNLTKTAKRSSNDYALFLDSEQLVTQHLLTVLCGFKDDFCLIPNPYEYEDMVHQKPRGLYNQTLGQLLQSSELCKKNITFAWFDYMNSLDGNVQDKKTGESSPREDISLYLLTLAKPYTLFAVTLCLRHSKYDTHDYTGGTEVVVMRFVNDIAREAGFYFSIIPPTGSYGSSMFIYAGILLPFTK